MYGYSQRRKRLIAFKIASFAALTFIVLMPKLDQVDLGSLLRLPPVVGDAQAAPAG
jgi:hypothetical protein